MAAITPSTNLKLLKNPNNLSSQHQLTFTNATSQFNYFNNLTKLEVDNFTYQRKDYVIRYNACIDDILDYNYCMYQNEAYGDKWFYAYIVNMRYVNDNVTEITIKTDVFQTFQFDINYKACFVEREHVMNDTVGINTVPEDLEIGDYVRQEGTETPAQTIDIRYLNNTYIVIAVSDPSFLGLTVPAYNDGKRYGGVYSGLWYYVFRNGHQADLFVQAIQGVTTQDIIYSVFMIPQKLLTISSSEWIQASIGGTTVEFAYCPVNDNYTNMGSIAIIKENYLDTNYVPRNNKLLCYPYRYLLISNNSGASQVYKYELFNTTSEPTQCQFDLYGTISNGCSIKLIPKDYMAGRLIESLDAPKLPNCSWTNDSYTNWLTQNAINFPLDTVRNYAMMGAGAFMLGSGLGGVAGAGLIGAGIVGIGETMKTKYEHSLVPDTAKGGMNQGDLNFAMKNTFSINKMSIRNEWASRIDKYFDMFGYKVNNVKIPNINGRSTWNYVKCIGSNIEGLIPEYYIDEINNLFNNGITLWHDPSKFLDYSQSNIIVTP